MRLLWINEFPSFVGGCERYLFDTAHLLKEKGIQSTLLYQGNHTADPSFLNGFDQAYPIADLKSQLEAIQPDLIFLHQFWDVSQYPLLREQPAPVLRFFHDYRIFCLRQSKITTLRKKPCPVVSGPVCYPCLGFINHADNPLGVRIKCLSELRHEQNEEMKFDGFIVGSHYMRDHVIAHGFPPEKVETVKLYSPLPQHESFPQRDPHLVLFVGQLIRGKGVDYAIEAIAKLPEPIRLEIAGEGKQEGDFRALTKQLGIENRVRFLGQLTEAELNAHYLKAACLVHPPRYPEPFGLIGLEAMKHSLPVVSVKLGGIPEWLENEKTGLIVSPESPNEIATALNHILSDPHKGKKMGENGKQSYLNHFTPSQHIDSLLRIFRSSNNPNKDPIGLRYIPDPTIDLSKIMIPILDEIKSITLAHIEEKHLVCLALIGGYGKREGGIEYKEGKVFPHNNLDFILIVQNCSQKQIEKISHSIHQQLKKVMNRLDIGIDYSVLSKANISHSPHLLIWHDLVYGHQTLLGDEHFLSKLPFKTSSSIVAEDMKQLLVNRGTLLIINQWLNNKNHNEKSAERIKNKHLMKAIIGFGDALLYSLGDYNWSYVEKNRRIQTHSKIDESFKSLYQTATNYRFQPDDVLISFSNDEILKALEHVFLQCESNRLGIPIVNWQQYRERLAKHSLKRRFSSFYLLYQGVKGLLNWPSHQLGQTFIERASYLFSSPKERMGQFFPLIAFQLDDSNVRKEISNALGIESTDRNTIRSEYLKMWNAMGDIHFHQSLERWGLEL